MFVEMRVRVSIEILDRAYTPIQGLAITKIWVLVVMAIMADVSKQIVGRVPNLMLALARQLTAGPVPILILVGVYRMIVGLVHVWMRVRAIIEMLDPVLIKMLGHA